MGVSTDAIVVYGYVCDEEERPWDVEGGADWDEVLDAKVDAQPEVVGFGSDPWDTTPGQDDRAVFKAWLRETYAERMALYAKRAAIAERLKHGCDIDWHCSDGCPMPYVYIVGSRVVASRGDPVELKSLEVGADWDERLKAFVAEFGMTPPSDAGPRWWLMSWWG